MIKDFDMAYPTDIFSSWFSAMIKCVSKVVQTPEALAANFGLSIISSLIASKVYVIRNDGSTVPTNLWTLTLIASGEGKTPVFNFMVESLNDTSIKDNLVENVTSAAFHKKLNELKKVVMLSSEGTFFDNIRKQSDFIIPLLKTYDEDSINYARGNEEIKIDKSSLTVGIALQNDSFKQLQAEHRFKEFQSKGLIDRFLISIPETMLGKRKYVQSDMRIPYSIVESYNECIKNLDIKYSSNNPWFLHLSDEATATLNNWLNMHEDDYNQEKYKNIHQWLGKREGFILRLAGCIYIIDLLQEELDGLTDDDPLYEKDKISSKQLENAITLLEYYQAEKLKLQTNTSFENEGIQKLWNYLTKHKIKEITKRDLQKALKGTNALKDKKNFDLALSELKTKGYISVEERKTKGPVSTVIHIIKD